MVRTPCGPGEGSWGPRPGLLASWCPRRGLGGETDLGSCSRSALFWLSGLGRFPELSKPRGPAREARGRELSVSTGLLQGLNVTTLENHPQ